MLDQEEGLQCERGFGTMVQLPRRERVVEGNNEHAEKKAQVWVRTTNQRDCGS